MSEEIIVITPEIAPGLGGVADYTRHVVEEWRGLCEVCILVPKPSDRSAAFLSENLPKCGGKVLLQYSAYGFDRWGYPRWLLRALPEFRRNSGGRLILMLHETWAFWPWWNKNYPVQQLHRRALGRLLRAADAVFTTTDKQAGQLRGLVPSCDVQVMPVGANVRPQENGHRTREPGWVVLFGRQLARVRTLRAMQTDLKVLAAAGRISRMITVGAGDTSDGVEKTLLASLQLSDGFEQRGAQAEEAVSRLFFQASFALSELDEHNVPKSSVFMNYAAHGLNILSPWAGAGQAPPFSWTIHPNELLKGLAADELETRAANLRAWQERTGSWATIAERFAAALEIGGR